MNKKKPSSPEVERFIAVLERIGGRIEHIDLRVYNNCLYIVCQCNNVDDKQFCDYLRGGNSKEKYIRCMVCGESVPLQEIQEKHKALRKQYGK